MNLQARWREVRPTAGEADPDEPVGTPPLSPTDGRGPRPDAGVAGPAALAFVAVVPVVLVLGAVGALVMPLLIHPPQPGRPGLRFFNGVGLTPEPLEQARYFLFLVGAPAVVGMSVVFARALRGVRLPDRLLVRCSLLIEVLAAISVVVWWRHQQADYPYFSGAVLLFAAGAAAGVTSALYSWRSRAGRTAAADGTWAAATAVLVALSITAIALLPALFHESNLAPSSPVVQFHLSFTMDEFVAVANGRTPLVDFIPQYSNVLPYLLSPLLSIIGFSVGSFTSTMFLLSMTSLLAVFYVFARVSGSWVKGLVLYLPFVGLTLYRTISEGSQHVFVANYFAAMPLRYFGPWLVAGLLVWQAHRPSRRRLLALFVVAGTMMLNNPDFGIPSFAAAVCATWLGAGREALRSLAWARAVLTSAAVGLGSATGVIVVISMLRTGELPNFMLALSFARMFALAGFYMLPMPSSGLHLVIGLTFAGALVRALFRSVSANHQGDRARLLTGAMAYGAIFGLGAASYYVGRSHPHVLVALFSAWIFVLGLLLCDAVVDIRQATGRASSVRVLWLLPCALVASQVFLAVAPAWEMRDVRAQVDRITADGMPAVLRNDELVSFVRAHADRGETVMILAPLSHLTALRAGVRDAFPYNSIRSVITHEQLDIMRGRLRDEGISKVFSGVPLAPEVEGLLHGEGFNPVADSRYPERPAFWQRPHVGADGSRLD